MCQSQSDLHKAVEYSNAKCLQILHRFFNSGWKNIHKQNKVELNPHGNDSQYVI